jgi:CelD/BcsL family acetyltransferase involved in cellulose biosynthesis
MIVRDAQMPTLPGSAGPLQVELICSFRGLEALAPEWAELHCSSGSRNPFAAPDWSLLWARHFIAERDIRVFVVRGDGGLAGVIPMYLHRQLGGLFTTLRLIGSGHHVRLFELPQPLIAPGFERKALRAVVQCACVRGEWDWLELTLAPEHGWFEPQWIPPEVQAAGAYLVHKAARPCVVMELPDAQQPLSAVLKRNVRNSVARSRNRLDRAGSWRVTDSCSPADADATLDALIGLHEGRARLHDKVEHISNFTEAGNRAFLLELARRLVASGAMRPVLLELDGEPVAGLITLRAGDSVYVGLSGVAARAWDLSPVTTLIATELERATAAGARAANLSPGPDVAKLRWSERLSVFNEFVVVASRRRSQLLSNVAFPARAYAVARRERARHRRSV